ncbi:MAG: sigma-54 dependent transcriptional regulator [Desulfuromonadales bacterium]|nr:sigma-54 dependent transcriptional regulator [Desulfuromonadales bacterium]
MDEKILICDDEEGMRLYLGKILRNWNYQVESFAEPEMLLRWANETESVGSLLLLDIKMAQMDGIEALRRIKQLRPALPVVMMTGHGTIESAVEAMKLGAYDYLTKPFPQEKLLAMVRHCLEAQRLREENNILKREIREHHIPAPPVFQSSRFGEVLQMAQDVADSDAAILILGESGTGKELIASSIHYASRRAEQRFLTVNCAALSETLLESQLFGHLKGAFTGATQTQKGLLEEADGGTLFLDEIGELSPALQAKLLRVLQFGEVLPVGSTKPRQVDVRFLAATNKKLEQEIVKGNFREDLFYRINVISLELPPLRDRVEDIEPLARHFLDRMATKLRYPLPLIQPAAMAAMQRYHWPGNVRELENVISRCAILSRGNPIGTELLPFNTAAASHLQLPPDSPFTLREAEKLQVLRALEQTAWNKKQAAQLLETSRKTLDRKIKEYHLSQDSSADR